MSWHVLSRLVDELISAWRERVIAGPLAASGIWETGHPSIQEGDGCL